MNMRRKPSSQNNGGNFGQHRQQKPRFQGGGGGGGGGAQYNRPRKNYGQLREKYLAQARDALAQGDRVLAENYYQHADHCYRMLMEENASRPPRPQHNQQVQQNEGEEGNSQDGQQDGNQMTEEEMTPHASALPAFLTGVGAANAPAEPPAVQDWEERDQA